MLGITVTLNKVDSDFRCGECYKKEGEDRVLKWYLTWRHKILGGRLRRLYKEVTFSGKGNSQ